MTKGANATDQAITVRPAPSLHSLLAAWFWCVVREPLIHFLLLGALLFGIYMQFQDRTAPSAQKIVVSSGKIEHLSAIFSKTWQRPPTVQELQGLIDDYVREEVAYREGKDIGLDQDDTIIRRRIRQKLDFFAEDLASQTEPTELHLTEFFEQHKSSYTSESAYTFRQIFFDPERHDAGLDQEISSLVKTLEKEPSKDTSEMGDRSLLEHQYQSLSQREVTGTFGVEFSSQIVNLPLQVWQGPIRSSYGLHVVIIDEKRSGRMPTLDTVRDAVRRDWEHKQRKELAESYYQRLQDKYRVTIEWPEAVSSEK